jgi:hypothetical protein
MSKLAMLLALFVMYAPALTAQGSGGRNILKNGDFEKFSGDTPAGWESTNIPNMLTVVSRSGTSRSGKYSVKCEVKDFYGTKMGGMLCLKDLRVQGTLLTVKGYYSLRSVGKDVGFLSVSFKNDQGSALGSVEEFLSKSSREFVPITKTGPIPDDATALDVHLTLLAGSDSGTLHEGTYVLFDDMEILVSEEKTE